MKDDVFFAFTVKAPFFKEPFGKIVQEKFRHITLVFLKGLFLKDINLKKVPTPSFKIAPCGFFNKIIFLPKDVKRVVAYEIDWIKNKDDVKNYQKILLDFLKKNNLIKNEKKFLEHVTVCRAPFDPILWKKSFQKIPFTIISLVLYKSLGNSEYEIIWKHKLKEPFKEIEHTADIAFDIKGENFTDLFYNAFTALCFKFPKFLNYPLKKYSFFKIEDVILTLNDLLTRADLDIGSPFKAISFSSKITKTDILSWEMIVDV